MDPVDNIENFKLGVFYFNKADSRIVVPKRTRSFGWTMNFAHRGSYAFMVAIIGSIVLVIVFS
jgi:uncharacterized membrane protein